MRKRIKIVCNQTHRYQKEKLKVGGIASDNACRPCAPTEKITADCHCGSPSFFIQASDGMVRIPALVDLHVHLREPDCPQKETIKSGTQAAKAGGYSVVCAMPNVKPAPDCLANLKVQLDIINRDAEVKVLPYGCITMGRMGKEPARYEELMPYVAGFSDDGTGIEDDDLMRECMTRIAGLGGLIVTHCEKEPPLSLPEGRSKNLCSADFSEAWQKVRMAEACEVGRNIRLAKETGCRLHLCHISTKESLDFIRKAKAEGVNVTCETAPHYLVFDTSMKDDSWDGRFKMNPPVGTPLDREALIEALKDGTIDVIATDHAPHTSEEKSKGFVNSLNGIIGLETAFPVMYTNFVRTGIITMERLVELMSLNARKILGLDIDSYIDVDLETPYVIDPEQFRSKGRSCPFEGMRVFGKVSLE